MNHPDVPNAALPACARKTLQVTTKDLPLSCPTPQMVLWNAHPKVFLPIEATGQATCPYCNTHFLLEPEHV